MQFLRNSIIVYTRLSWQTNVERSNVNGGGNGAQLPPVSWVTLRRQKNGEDMGKKREDIQKDKNVTVTIFYNIYLRVC